jgi:hypothetical protein
MDAEERQRCGEATAPWRGKREPLEGLASVGQNVPNRSLYKIPLFAGKTHRKPSEFGAICLLISAKTGRRS